MLRQLIALTVLLFVNISVTGKTRERAQLTKEWVADSTKNHINWKNSAFPLAAIGFGIVGIENQGIQDFNRDIQETIMEKVDREYTIDNYLQYAPAASVLALNLAGVKGKNSNFDATLVYGTSILLMVCIVSPMKNKFKVKRPSGYSTSSFPSNHTATAFASAELLYQEYKDQSVWYGVAGYAVATTTGIYRLINNRHWLTDVIAGAGIGILSTKLAYLIHKRGINRRRFRREVMENTQAILLPYHNRESTGVTLAFQF